MNDADFVRIVEIFPDATIKRGNRQHPHSFILSLDCIQNWKGGSFWDQAGEHVERLHQEARALFFGLLTDATLAKLEPIYD